MVFDLFPQQILHTNYTYIQMGFTVNMHMEVEECFRGVVACFHLEVLYSGIPPSIYGSYICSVMYAKCMYSIPSYMDDAGDFICGSYVHIHAS